MNDTKVERPGLPIALLCNPKAGKGKATSVFNILSGQLKQHRISFDAFTLQWPETLYAYREVWLIGGDGTLNYFINRYPQLQIPVALFKGGSGNDFAWKLYGDISLEAYLQRALNNNLLAVDAGNCNGKLFINGAGIGFDGQTVKNMGNRRFISAGHIAYLITVIKTIFTYRESVMTVTTEKKNYAEKFLMINVANGSRYGGGFMVAPQAIIDDGLLDVVLVKPLSTIKRLMNLPKIEKGSHLNLPFVKTMQAKSIHIKTEKKVAAHLDGELLESDEFDIQILPGKFTFKI